MFLHGDSFSLHFKETAAPKALDKKLVPGTLGWFLLIFDLSDRLNWNPLGILSDHTQKFNLFKYSSGTLINVDTREINTVSTYAQLHASSCR